MDILILIILIGVLAGFFMGIIDNSIAIELLEINNIVIKIFIYNNLLLSINFTK